MCDVHFWKFSASWIEENFLLASRSEEAREEKPCEQVGSVLEGLEKFLNGIYFLFVLFLIYGRISKQFSVGKYYISVDNQTSFELKRHWCSPLPEYVLLACPIELQWRRVSGKSSWPTFPSSGLSAALTDFSLQALSEEYSSTYFTHSPYRALKHLGKWEGKISSKSGDLLQR